jgi:hypothetical protein
LPCGRSDRWPLNKAKALELMGQALRGLSQFAWLLCGAKGLTYANVAVHSEVT